jgi:hypothetical protein
MKTAKPRVIWDCASCGMPIPEHTKYHPYLYCVLYRHYKRDPADVLREHGFERRRAAAERTAKRITG